MEIYVNFLSIYLIICLLANIIQLCGIGLIAHECDPHFPSVTCQLKEIFHLCHGGLLCCEFHIRPPNSNNWRQSISIARTTLKFLFECKAQVRNISAAHWKYITMTSENDWNEFLLRICTYLGMSTFDVYLYIDGCWIYNYFICKAFMTSWVLASHTSAVPNAKLISRYLLQNILAILYKSRYSLCSHILRNIVG